MQNYQKIITGVACLLILSLGFWGGKYLLTVQKYKKIIKDISINSIDISKIADGKYTGSLDAIMVGAKVSVTVKEHKITDIVLLEHKNERGKSAEVIPQKVIKVQSLEVDTISGATNSSRVILKAIENALEAGSKE